MLSQITFANVNWKYRVLNIYQILFLCPIKSSCWHIYIWYLNHPYITHWLISEIIYNFVSKFSAFCSLKATWAIADNANLYWYIVRQHWLTLSFQHGRKINYYVPSLALTRYISDVSIQVVKHFLSCVAPLDLIILSNWP